MNVKRVVEKGKWVLMTTGLAIVSSLFFFYIKGYFWIDTGNAEQVNAKVEFNDLILLYFWLQACIKNVHMCKCGHVYMCTCPHC